MTPRSISLGPESQDLGRADQDCITAPAQDVRAWLLASVSLGTMAGMSDRNSRGQAIDGYGYESAWLARAVLAYGRTRKDWQPRDRIKVEAWFLDQGEFLARMIDRHLTALWPLRLRLDYSQQGHDTKGSSTTFPDGRAVPWSAQYYNNRRGLQALAVGLIGLTLGDAAMQQTAAQYVQEWVRFGVWADGVCADWERAGEKGVAMQGPIYCCINAAVALELAMRFDDAGDRRLIDYSHDRRTVWTAGDRLARLWDDSEPLVMRDGTKADPLVGLNGARPMHWTYLLPAYRRYGRAAALPREAGEGDYYWIPRAGLVGMHAA